MAKHRIAWLPGDGIGVEVMDAARTVLDAVGFDAEYEHGDIGWEFWKSEGDPLPDRTLDLLRRTDAALFGAITSLPKEEAEEALNPELRGKGLVYRSPIVRLRQEFGLRTNRRPCFAFPGNPLNYREGIDLVVFRENTEGLYAGVEFHPVPDGVREALAAESPAMKKFDSVASGDMAIACRIITREGARRIIRDAFAFAKEKGYPSVTVVEKPNVLRETSGLMVREAREVAKEFPGVELWETNIDAMAMWLVKNPETYGVIVCSNLFGDIISDLCAQLVGGLGFAASGNIGESCAVFEPTHGSAPKYAGQNKVNPMAMFLSAQMMLDWLGETDKAERVKRAVAGVIAEGKVRTYDMGGSATTTEAGDAVARLAG
ncbi:MAG: isocitrate/isopropylmalate dehydrogenase family protein [Gemmatimonadota bacterium]|jgi:3-isopropylmalate dehydrogenase|nr:isocitrate/isopropylmalate dehydrogenase family protein [Gemmatimonadota bacterium]MDP6801614.1 isocitrate/isopropylmalate dehydrogenase family protein [Gemmatimonadota bacterium]MDP7030839.1 isocitrate/isopropylmalate dehydrogenase family protein [Gemmatimonadota bacterium]